MHYSIILDLETTNEGPNGSPEAHWLNNSVLKCGWQRPGGLGHIQDDTAPLIKYIDNCLENGSQVTLVAHNAKFDLKYLMRDHPGHRWDEISVFDTMTFEYLDSGHLDKMMSLEDACRKRGVLNPHKTFDLGAYLNAGNLMRNIPEADLEEYLEQDLNLLGELYYRQMSGCNGEPPWMDYILPLADMELNGMHIDRQETMLRMQAETLVMDRATSYFIDVIKEHCEWQDGSPIVDEDFTPEQGVKSKCIKPMSNRTFSFLYTGIPGELKVTNKWRVRYKPGPRRFPLYNPNGMPEFTDPNPIQGYPMNESVLNQLAMPESTLILDYRHSSKLVGTYYGPFLEESAHQGCIYPKINTAVTGTGRLSSSNPNGQNIPPQAREVIRPRDPTYSVFEFDFSQLEMLAVACIARCPDLIKDLLNGVDVHFESGKSVMGWTKPSDMTEQDRKVVKNVNFGVLYGGKAAGLSKQTGVDKQIVQKLIDSFFTRYPRIAKNQEETFTRVVDHMMVYRHDDNGEQVYKSTIQDNVSGRKFTFVEQKAPPWLKAKTGRTYSFSPNQTANYPIQGFAGGDIVLYTLYHFWKIVRYTCRFIMTVHDSIIIEGDSGITKHYTDSMESAIDKTVTKYNLPVRPECHVKTGPTWS